LPLAASDDDDETDQPVEQVHYEGATMSEETSSNGSPYEQVLPDAGFVLDRPRAALVVIDPQERLREPRRAGWALFGQSVTEDNVVANLARLFQEAERVPQFAEYEKQTDRVIPVVVLTPTKTGLRAVASALRRIGIAP
jgi:hypothetical protein